MNESRRKLYLTWKNMRTRCLDPRSARYRDYGGRGITICPEWDSFETFLRDMGPRPDGTTLDRIDNSKGYSPSNCKWSTPTEQNRNRRSTRWLTFQGKTQTMLAWEKELGLARGALSQRIKRGWDISALLQGSTRPSEKIRIAARNRSGSHVR